MQEIEPGKCHMTENMQSPNGDSVVEQYSIHFRQRWHVSLHSSIVDAAHQKFAYFQSTNNHSRTVVIAVILMFVMWPISKSDQSSTITVVTCPVVLVVTMLLRPL